MKKSSTEYYKRRLIKELQRDISEIEIGYYSTGLDKDEAIAADEIEQMIFLLKNRKASLVRAIVFDNCLFIEDLITHGIKHFILKNNSRLKRSHKYPIASSNTSAKKALYELLESGRSVGFKDKIVILESAGLIDIRISRQLSAINTIRNKCAHNWDIDKVIRQNVNRAQKKNPILQYKGFNLNKKRGLEKFLKDCAHLITYFVSK